MKILLGSDSYEPVVSGLVTVVRDQSRALAARGHEVHLIIPGTSFRKRTSVSHGVTIHHVRSAKNPIRKDHHIPLSTRNHVNSIIQQIQPDIIHAHTPGPVGTALLRSAKQNSTPIVASCHGIPEYTMTYTTLHPRVKRTLETSMWRFFRWFYNQTDAVIAPAPYIQSKLSTHGIQTRSHEIPMWINRLKTSSRRGKQLRNQWDIHHDDVVFLYFGRLDKDKNLPTLLHAFANTQKKRNQKKRAKLVLAGKGNMTTELEGIAQALDIAHDTIFTGFVDEGTIPDLYSAADVFVMPALYEAQSIVTLSAVYTGLPVILAESSALTDIAQRFPKQSTTFTKTSAHILTRHMHSYVKTQESTERFVPHKFGRYYSKATVLQKLLSLYRDVGSI